jgi:hypothetical protein
MPYFPPFTLQFLPTAEQAAAAATAAINQLSAHLAYAQDLCLRQRHRHGAGRFPALSVCLATLPQRFALQLDSANFQFVASNPSPDLTLAFARYTPLFFPHRSTSAKFGDEPVITGVSVQVSNTSGILQLETDESYTLTVRLPGRRWRCLPFPFILPWAPMVVDPGHGRHRHHHGSHRVWRLPRARDLLPAGGL